MGKNINMNSNYDFPDILNIYNTVKPSIWGPHFWYLIHNYSSNYSEVPSKMEKEIAKLFVKILPFLLPCGTCSNYTYNYIKQNIKNRSDADKVFSSRKNFFEFFFKLHNSLNNNIVDNKKEDMEKYFLKYYTQNKSVWGPHFWYVIHNFSANYSVFPSAVEEEIAKKFVKIIPFIIPCSECSEHAYNYIKENVNEDSGIFSSKKSLSKFFFDFHNSVNKRLNKKQYTWEKN